jgi:hypothetical protein
MGWGCGFALRVKRLGRFFSGFLQGPSRSPTADSPFCPSCTPPTWQTPAVAVKLAAFSRDGLHLSSRHPRRSFAQFLITTTRCFLSLVHLSGRTRSLQSPISSNTPTRCSARYLGSGENRWLPGAPHTADLHLMILHATIYISIPGALRCSILIHCLA